jgi:hypothetical protein
MVTPLKISDLRDELRRQLQAVPGVGAVGVGWTASGERCLRVSVEPGFAQKDKIPAVFHGILVAVQAAEVGSFSSK